MSSTYASVTLIRDLEGRLWAIAAAQTRRGDVYAVSAFEFDEYSTGITDFHGKVLVDGAREWIRERVADALDVDQVFIVGMLNAMGLAATPDMLQYGKPV